MVVFSHFKRINYLAFVVLILTASFLLVSRYLYSSQSSSRLNLPIIELDDGHQYLEPVPCLGPRGLPLTETPGDNLKPSTLEGRYPKPLAGSYTALNLDKTWMTADDRYGAYGYGEDRTDRSRSRVDWDSVSWAALQDDCLERNKERFLKSTKLRSPPRMSLPSWTTKLKMKWNMPVSPVRDQKLSTGRIAIVVRLWEGHKLSTHDRIFLRSLIVEAALSSGVKYAVYLLVDVHDRGRNIWASEANYNAALDDLLPKEFHSIGMLFDGKLLDEWYPKVGEHSPFWQVFQPLQLFAQTYNKFDHYWNLELDVRFTSHTLHYLEALSRFSRNEPRKQMWERASYRYMPAIHGTYHNFLSTVNRSLEGRGLWQPPPTPEFPNPAGPLPPVPDPILDDFHWGVGDDADFISMVPCQNVTFEPRWFGESYVFGFEHGRDTPRFFCPQAVGRASWTLLNAIHAAQFDKGLRVPSEATLPSFAYWHGLKVSLPPQPWFVIPKQGDVRRMDEILNGGQPLRKEWMGFANGTKLWDDTVHEEFQETIHPTYRWGSIFPGELMDAWLGTEVDAGGKSELPYLLRRGDDGKVYAPSLMLHPVKP